MANPANSARCDVLIVGGGPAGLAAAIATRRKGLDVLVVDPLHPPIDKACGEGLLPDSQDELARLGLVVPQGDGWPFHGITFCSGRHQVSALFARGLGMGLRRLRLHSLLADHCRQMGVRLAWGSQVTLTAGQPVLLDGGRCLFRYLIGADGHSSRVRRQSGLDAGARSRSRFGTRRHFRVAPWSSMVEVHWCDLGQAYVTPIAADEVCVAVLTRFPSTRMDTVMEELRS